MPNPFRRLARRAPGSVTVLAAVAALAALAAAAAAAPSIGRDDASLAGLDRAVARGELSYAEAAWQKYFYVFDRAGMDERWNLDGGRPAKCATFVLEELQKNLAQLDPELQGLVSERVDATPPPTTDVLLTTQTAHFYIEYNNSGPNVVPLTDVSPANGIPDFVDKAAQYLEESWTEEVTNLGYTAPPPTSAPSFASKYRIQFATQGSYGFTSGLSGGRSQITLHNNYAGFPPNDDPEGDVLGAMKVTIAHEFKHAIQRAMSNWSEGGWLELDATWVEDIVYDQTNDYYNYISGPGSPFTEPATPLDLDAAATTGSYEDCNWELYQTERYGLPHMLAFWTRRVTHQVESVMTTYAQNFIASGTTLAAAWGEYVAWNFACGARAGTNGFGYGEAADYPTTPALASSVTLPFASGGTVQHLASHTYLVTNAEGTLHGTPKFDFNGQNTTVWGVSVLTKDKATGAVTWYPLTLVAGVGSITLTGVDYASLDYAALVIGNANTGASLAYTFNASASAPVFVQHARLQDRVDNGAPEAVVAKVTSGSGTLDTASPLLRYRVDGGSVVDVAMTPTGNPDEYSAPLPQQGVGATVEYRIEAQSTLAEGVSSPGLPDTYYAYDVVTVYEPFETDNGWTVGAPGDAAISGVWTRVTPVGTAAQPGEDITWSPGTVCFVTQNGSIGGPLGEADVDGGATTLLSPVFNLGDGKPYSSAIVRFHRWYSNGLSIQDDTWRVDVSNDGGGSWQNLETVTFGEQAWVLVSDDLKARFGALDLLRFRFVVSDLGTGSIVEAAIDQFEIIAVPQSGVGVPAGSLAAGLRLGPARPNPATAGAGLSLELDLPEASPVAVRVLDVKGRVVREVLPAGTLLPAGGTRISWDGRTRAGAQAAPGVYLMQVLAAGNRAERKVTILR
jgi:hypothetical protein